MKKVLLTGLVVGLFGWAFGQTLESTEKGRDFIQQMELALEAYYGHDMKLTPGYAKGAKEYAYESAGSPLPETPFEGNAHYYTAMNFEPELFETVDNAKLVSILAPDDSMNGQIKEMLETINPNRFFVESYLIKDRMYVVLGLDRPFDYTTWKAEE
jgi:hypothetical protein